MSPRRSSRARERPAPPPRRSADAEAALARRRGDAERCARKQWFASEAEARAFALMHRSQWGEDGSPYRCDLCDGWHLATRRAR